MPEHRLSDPGWRKLCSISSSADIPSSTSIPPTPPAENCEDCFDTKRPDGTIAPPRPSNSTWRLLGGRSNIPWSRNLFRGRSVWSDRRPSSATATPGNSGDELEDTNLNKVSRVEQPPVIARTIACLQELGLKSKRHKLKKIRNEIPFFFYLSWQRIFLPCNGFNLGMITCILIPEQLKFHYLRPWLYIGRILDEANETHSKKAMKCDINGDIRKCVCIRGMVGEVFTCLLRARFPVAVTIASNNFKLRSMSVESSIVKQNSEISSKIV